MAYEIIISGTPVAKSRPRGFKTKKGNIGFYTPTKTKDFEYLVRKRAEEVFDKPLDGAIFLSVSFYLPRPKRLIWKTKPMPEIPHTTRSDLDNLIKSVSDGLNGVAYADDSQISELYAKKMYRAGGDGPRTVIKISKTKP